MALTLYVEGGLDAAILSPFLDGLGVTVERGGSKNALPHEARRHRGDVVYVRDRDFDADPPTKMTAPVVHLVEGDRPLGWTWARHAIESYLIEPAIFCAAIGADAEDWTAELSASAARIRAYQAARWTVGEARRALPPNYKLESYPRGCKGDFKLPSELDDDAQVAWMGAHVGAFRAQIEPLLADAALSEAFATRRATFDEAFVEDIPRVLVWFSGKDLLAAARAWLEARGLGAPSPVRARVRDHLIEHPDLITAHLPEWNALRSALAARQA